MCCVHDDDASETEAFKLHVVHTETEVHGKFHMCWGCCCRGGRPTVHASQEMLKAVTQLPCLFGRRLGAALPLAHGAWNCRCCCWCVCLVAADKLVCSSQSLRQAHGYVKASQQSKGCAQEPRWWGRAAVEDSRWIRLLLWQVCASDGYCGLEGFTLMSGTMLEALFWPVLAWSQSFYHTDWFKNFC